MYEGEGKKKRHVPTGNRSIQEDYLAGVLNSTNKSAPIKGETILTGHLFTCPRVPEKD